VVKAVYCEHKHSYVTADGFTCPPGCRRDPPRGCALQKPELYEADPFKPHCFGNAYMDHNPDECDLCPYLEQCCLEAVMR